MESLQTYLRFPFEINPLDSDLNDELMKYFHGERTGFVQVGPEKYFFPHKYLKEAENYYNFKARPNDIWVVSFPRSGTTWTQELVWLLTNNCDFERAKQIPLTRRFPFFEFNIFLHPFMEEELVALNKSNERNLKFIEQLSKPGYMLLDEIPSNEPRFIKSHFPFSLLPPSIMTQKCKIIYVARNPKDVAVSFYHLNRLYRTQGYCGDFERYWSYFTRGLNPWLPYFSHRQEALQHHNKENVLCLNYEEMITNLTETIDKVSLFLLNCKPGQEKVNALLKHLHFDNFRMNPSVNGTEMAKVSVLNQNVEYTGGFIRRGQSGIKHEEFQNVPGLLKKANQWIEDNEKKITK